MKRIKGLRGLLVAITLLTLAILAAGPSDAAFAQSETGSIVLLEATGPVVPPLAGYIRRGLEQADSRNAEAVILMLDTPGGSVNTMFEIVRELRNSDVPVIVYVGPRGAKAGSAGLPITIAGHVSAMAPETAIGASSVISSTGEEVDSTAKRKTEEAIVAQARSMMEGRSEEAIQLVEDAVFEARAVSSQEALDAGLIDFIADDVDELLAMLDGFTVTVNGRERTLDTTDIVIDRIPMTQVERALLVITDPNIVFLLLSIGMTAIIVEIRTPGGWISGVVGVTALGFALYGLGVLPVNWLGLAFILMAFVLFILEIKAATHGALAAAGVISLAVGGIILFNQPEIAPFGELSIPLVIAQSLLLGGVFAFLITFALRAQRLQPTTGREGMIGQVGHVTQALDPRGMVSVVGERWQAESADGAFIAVGRDVEVVSTGQMRLQVRALSGKQPSESPSG